MTPELEVILELKRIKNEIRTLRKDNVKVCKTKYLDIDSGYVRVIRTMEKLVDNMIEEVNGCK
jgi:hypothetical protein